MEKYPEMLTEEEVSFILKISKDLACQVMKRDEFPSIKLFGDILRVRRDLFEMWLDNPY